MVSVSIVSTILVLCLGSVGLARGDGVGQGDRDKRILLSDPQVFQAQLEEMQRRIQALEAQGNVQQASQGTGSVYTVWGRKSCPAVNGTTTVYTGITGGKHYNEAGGGINTLCLPHDPEDAPTDFPTSLQVAGRVSHLYGSEYQFTYRKYALDDDVPCAVCRVESATSVMMIPAKYSCPNSWNTQYRGFLVSDSAGNDITWQGFDYICLHNDAEYLTEGARRHDDNGHILFPVQAVCGSLPCPPYKNGQYITCAVCTL